MNVIIATPWVPSAISTTAGTDADWPIANAATLQPREPVVFTDSVVAIDVDLGDALDVDVVALIATGATHWTVRAASTQAGLETAADLVDEAVGLSSGVCSLFWDGVTRTEQWWRISLTGVVNYALGRLFIGPAWQPTYNYELGSVRGRAPGQAFDTGAGGALYPQLRPQHKRWALTLGDVTDAEYVAELDALDEYTAGGGEVLLCRDPDPANTDRLSESMYALMALAQGATRVRYNRWRAAAVFDELT